MGNCAGMILWFFLICAGVLAVKWDTPVSYDPVWLASVEQYGSVTSLNETRMFWAWVTEDDITFDLYTRTNPEVPQVLIINDTSVLRQSNFDFRKKVKFLCHGWTNNASSPMPTSLRRAYLNASDLNIIVVDWGKAAMTNYITASYNVALAGRVVTAFLDFLIREGVSMNDMHLIGHSLGAHVVGIAGAYVSKGPIDAITGLDPALPLFRFAGMDARLDKHDARFVEVIHTCGGYLGFYSPLGHLDFYPNGGQRQPGCGYDIRGFCGHNRAHQYFAESILADSAFVGVRCESYDELYYNGYCEGTGDTLIMGGLSIHYGKEGVYYLETNAEPPFAMQKRDGDQPDTVGKNDENLLDTIVKNDMVLPGTVGKKDEDLPDTIINTDGDMTNTINKKGGSKLDTMGKRDGDMPNTIGKSDGNLPDTLGKRDLPDQTPWV